MAAKPGGARPCVGRSVAVADSPEESPARGVETQSPMPESSAQRTLVKSPARAVGGGLATPTPSASTWASSATIRHHPARSPRPPSPGRATAHAARWSLEPSGLGDEGHADRGARRGAEPDAAAGTRAPGPSPRAGTVPEPAPWTRNPSRSPSPEPEPAPTPEPVAERRRRREPEPSPRTADAPSRAPEAVRTPPASRGFCARLFGAAGPAATQRLSGRAPPARGRPARAEPRGRPGADRRPRRSPRRRPEPASPAGRSEPTRAGAADRRRAAEPPEPSAEARRR